MSTRKMLWARSGTCSKNSISASQVRLKENLVNAWVLHTPTPFFMALHHGLLILYIHDYMYMCKLLCEHLT